MSSISSDFLAYINAGFNYCVNFGKSAVSGISGIVQSAFAALANTFNKTAQPLLGRVQNLTQIYRPRPPTIILSRFFADTIAVRGLKNGAYNCAFNSLLQMIYHSAPLYNLLHTIEKYPELRRLHEHYFDKNIQPDTRQFRDMLCRNHSVIPGGIAFQDASEALSLMLENLPSNLARTLPSARTIRTYNPIPVNIFANPGGERSYLDRNHQLIPASTSNPMLMLEVGSSFDQKLTAALDKEITDPSETAKFLGLDPDLIYEHSCIREKLEFDEMPNYLLVTLKRFEFNPSNPSEPRKIATPMPVPRVLELPENVVPVGTIDRRLTLRSFIVHSPGHYTSYVLKEGAWYHCNDDRVVKVDDADVESALRTSYMHYYEREGLPTTAYAG